MSNPIIEVENLSKLYQIGAKEAYGSLRDEIMQAITSPFKRRSLSALRHAHCDEIWALKDVSFSVNEGEVVGIIGRNGAGKSTLLKILSKITEPTSGRIIMKGRVVSLLEVGTGFHPELTGRENIFLNGALLGMTNAEIRKKFDEIVAFSEIEKFLDTPVKRYSSGMYVRLAFAVAAHLEPEILVVDEVLAVGDAQFQKKCMGKMGEVAKGGRTVLFVSHNMAAIKNLCNRAILLGAGELLYNGGVNETVDCYLNNDQIHRSHDKVIPPTYPRIGSGRTKLCKVEILNQRGESVPEFYFGQPFRIVFTIGVKQRIRDEVMMFAYIVDADGTRFAAAYNVEHGKDGWQLEAGYYRVILEVDSVLLPNRTYSLDIGLYNRPGTEVYDFVERVVQFSVLPASEDGTDNYPGTQSHAFVRVSGRWHTPCYLGELQYKEAIME